MRISESKLKVTEEVKYAAKLRAEAEARRVIQEAEAVHQARAAAKAKAKAEIRSLAAAARAAAKAKAEAAAVEEARIAATGKDEWFYLQGNEQFGPVTLEDLRAKISDPELEAPIKLVWAEGMEMWRPVYEVRRVCDPNGNYDIRALTGEMTDEFEGEADELVGHDEYEAVSNVTAMQPEEGKANSDSQQNQELLEVRRRLEEQQRIIERATRERAEAEAHLRATAEARVLEESRLRENAEARAAELERLRSLTEAKVAEETRTLAEALAKALEEAKLREAAEARASEALRMQEVAESKVRAETLLRAAAEAKAAEEERSAAAARARADEESRAKALVEAKVAEEAREAALARAWAEEESKLRRAAEAKAAEEAKHAAAAHQRAEEESRAKARSEARATEEARIAACEKARAEEEARMRRAAEARASEEARQAAMAMARAENEAKAKADLEVRAAREETKAAIAKTRADEEARLRREVEARAVEEARQAAQATAGSHARVPEEPKPSEEPPAPVVAEAAPQHRNSNNQNPVSQVSSNSIDCANPDEDAMLDADIDALAAQEERLEALAKERAEKEAKARSEFKSRASQATRAAIVAKRKVRRQVLARAIESARMRALGEAASALMEERQPEELEGGTGVECPDAVEPAGMKSQPLPDEIKVNSVIESPVALEPVAVAESEFLQASSEPVPVVEPELRQSPCEPVAAKSASKRRHSILSGKRVWHYTCEGERVGPVSFQELKELASAAALDPRRDLVWKKGSPDWQPAGKIDGLFPRRAEEVEPTVKVRPAASNDVRPRAKSRVVPWRHVSWPGARRRSLWFFALVFPFVWEFSLRISQPHLTKQFGEIMVGKFLPVASSMPLLLLLLIGWKRLTNLGMSRWWCLAAFAPPVNLWIGYRCFACPSGYAHHRKLDVSGMVLAIVYWLVLLWTVWSLLGSHPQWYGWIENSSLKTQISQAIEQAGIAGASR